MLSGPIERTWNAIGSDMYECDPEIDNYGAVESVVDADRLAMYGGEEGEYANEIFKDLVAQFGYSPVLSFLILHFKLA